MVGELVCLSTLLHLYHEGQFSSMALEGDGASSSKRNAAVNEGGASFAQPLDTNRDQESYAWSLVITLAVDIGPDPSCCRTMDPDVALRTRLITLGCSSPPLRL